MVLIFAKPVLFVLSIYLYTESSYFNEIIMGCYGLLTHKFKLLMIVICLVYYSYSKLTEYIIGFNFADCQN